MRRTIVALAVWIALIACAAACAEDMEVAEWPDEVPEDAARAVTVAQAGEITDDWEDILSAIDDGTAPRRYAVGAWKALDLGKYGEIHMQLAGFGLDKRADGKGLAATTWIARELLPEPFNKEDNEITLFGWQNCALREYLQNRLYNAVPDPVRDRIVIVEKQQTYLAYNGLKTETSNDRLWIPDYEELFGEEARYFGLFRDEPERRVKTRRGAPDWWWCRSTANQYYSYFVTPDGDAGYIEGSDAQGGIALGFCL